MSNPPLNYYHDNLHWDHKDAREEIRRWHSISNRHENILSFRGYLLDEEQKKLGLISDYMENGTLSDYIRRVPVPSDGELLPLVCIILLSHHILLLIYEDRGSR